MFSVTTSPSGGIPAIIRLLLRFLQFVLALTVAGLYGTDLHHAQVQHKYSDSKWVYAEVVAGLSCVTAIVYMLPLVKAWMFWIWDAILFILWTALFGTFAKLYLGYSDPTHDGGITRMKHAVWVDLVNMLLWFITTCWGAFYFFTERRRRTLHTGRAEV